MNSRPMRVALAVAAVALSARIAAPMPGSMVPQSAQTLVVLLIGASLGARDGVLALVAYLALGAVGLPVFADGGSGWRHLIGPTAGYLLGFVVAAAAVGTLRDRGRLRRFLPTVGAMLGAHALILALGWARLWMILGAQTALVQGVTPFIVGGMVKSVIAAALAPLLTGRASRSLGEPD